MNTQNSSFRWIIAFCVFCVFMPGNGRSQVHLDSLLIVFQNEELPIEKRLWALDRFIMKKHLFGNPDSALHYAELEYQVAKKEDLTRFMGRALNHKATPLFIKGQLEQAIDINEQALAIGKANNHQGVIANVYNTFGWIYNNKGDYVQSINYFSEALKIREHLRDTGQDSSGIPGLLSSLGIVYTQQHDKQNAYQYYKRALDMAREEGDKGSVANTLSNMGNLFFDTPPDSLQMGIALFQEALDLHLEVGNLHNAIVSNSNIGAAYMQMGNYDKGIEYAKKSLPLAEKLGSPNLTVRSLLLLAELYTRSGNDQEAIVQIKRAMDISQINNSIELTRQAAITLSKIYRNTGNYKEALEYYELSENLQDSLVNEENQRTLLRNEYEYNYDKQLLADSLEFAQQQAIKDLEIQQQKSTLFLQRLALISTVIGLLLLIALAYFIYQSRKKSQLEAERLKELDYFKTRLYTNITHEFRTPLTVILGMADQISSQPKKFLQEGIDLIRRNGQNLLRLINQLLDLSKLESNTFHLNIQQSDLVPYLTYLTESYQSYANGKNLAIRFSSSERTLLMDFDPEQIKQIMTNLISNALKFTPSGGWVRVHLSRKGEMAQIEVEDTGVGISEKDLPYIFDRFYQADNEASQMGQGTGIGLAHTHELVKLMEGTISVESPVEGSKGTRFIISLPVRNEAAVETVEMANNASVTPEVEEAVLATNAGVKAGTSHLPKVLIIEDNPDVVVYLKSCLEGNYQLDIALNGNIGLEKAQAEVPDLIITDVMMPGMDGFEVCEHLKEDERTSHVPIIILTAKADVPSKIQGFKYGADAYLAKPFHQEELLIRIAQLIDTRQKLKSYFSRRLEAFPGEDALERDELIEKENEFIDSIRRILEDHISDEDFGLPQLCQKIGMSRSQLFRKMKALTDTAPSQFIKNYRLNKAQYLLKHSDKNVAEVAYEVGFKDPSYFSKIYQEAFGVLPSAANNG